MGVPDLAQASVAELGALLNSGTLSAAELSEACLRRIDALDPKVNAVIE